MGGAMLNKSLIQFSVEGQDSVPSLLLDLRPNCARDNEDNGDLLQKVSCRHCCTQCPQPCSWPPPTHASANPCLCQRLLDTHGQVWVSLFGVTAPFSWVLVCTRFCSCPPRVCFPSHVEVLKSNPTGLQSQSPCGYSVPLPDP